MNEKITDCNADQLRDIADAMDNVSIRQGYAIEEYIERRLLD